VRRPVSDQAEKGVRDAEEEWRRAFIAGDAGVLERLHEDEFESVNFLGALSKKSDVMSDVRAGRFRYESMAHEDVAVRIHGDVGIVVGVTVNKGMRGDRDVSGTFRFTRIWVRRNSAWRAIFAHYTRLGSVSP
jgi:ketosteroid isomerase-like protein